MKILYEGKSIENEVDVIKATLTERLGGAFDSLTVSFSDVDGKWSKWKPKKWDKIAVNGWSDSGEMYIDDISISRGVTTLKATPLKQSDRVEKSRTFEKVTLLELAQTIASESGLKLKTYGVPSITYEWIEQNTSNLVFLATQGELECVNVKVHNGSLILISDDYLDAQIPEVTLKKEDYPEPDYNDTAKDLIGVCRVVFGKISGVSNQGIGKSVIREITVCDKATADRYANNIIRRTNRLEKTVKPYGKLPKSIYSGVCIKMADYGIPDGNYIVEQLNRDLLKGGGLIIGRRVEK